MITIYSVLCILNYLYYMVSCIVDWKQKKNYVIVIIIT